MKARWRVLVVASVVLAAGAPAFAQEATQPAQNELIGNPQLRDFSLNGTVTQSAQDPAEAQSEPPQAASPPADRSPATGSRPSQPARESAASTGGQLPPRQQAGSSERASATVELPPPTPAPRIAAPSLTDEGSPTLAAQPSFVPTAGEPDLDSPAGGLPLLPWLAAALAFAAAAAWYFLRHRPRESFAGAGSVSAFDAPSPAPPPVRTPAPAADQLKPAPPKPVSPGIVSTRLRPWLELEFTPQRAIVDEQKAAIAFELSVFNSGSAPAREVLLEASLFNAGPMQDQQIRSFFENPVARGDRIPVIPPLKRVTVNTAVFLPIDQVRPIEVEGRKLFVPMIAFNALYGWGGGEGQSSASYLVGKVTKASEKLAPFRVDLGPRVFRNLAAREHELRLRK